MDNSRPNALRRRELWWIVGSTGAASICFVSGASQISHSYRIAAVVQSTEGVTPPIADKYAAQSHQAFVTGVLLLAIGAACILTLVALRSLRAKVSR